MQRWGAGEIEEKDKATVNKHSKSKNYGNEITLHLSSDRSIDDGKWDHYCTI